MIVGEPLTRKKTIRPATAVPILADIPLSEKAVVSFPFEARAAMAAFVEGAFSPLPKPAITVEIKTGIYDGKTPNPIKPMPPIRAPNPIIVRRPILSAEKPPNKLPNWNDIAYAANTKPTVEKLNPIESFNIIGKMGMTIYVPK